MRRSTARILYLAAIGLAVGGFAAAWIASKIFDPAIQSGTPPAAFYIVGVVAVVGLSTASVLLFTLYLASQVTLAQERQWSWFILLFLFIVPLLSYLALAIFLFAGPKEAKVTGRPQNDAALSRNLSANTPGLFRQVSRSKGIDGFSSLSEHYATWIERAASAALDFEFVITAFLVCGTIISLITWFLLFDASPILILSTSLVISFFTYIVVGVGIVFFVWPLQWTRRGQTFGQKVMHVKVVSEAGRNIPFGTALLRAVYMIFLDCIVFSIPLGWLWMFVDPKAQTWHDKAAGTVVVQIPEASTSK